MEPSRQMFYVIMSPRRYPAVLVRLSKISRKALRGLLRDASEFVTAKQCRSGS
jgi:hypothetical protein